ncbi:MAG: hypothetical protein AAF736_12635 [Pseudomonadota bacterium]
MSGQFLRTGSILLLFTSLALLVSACGQQPAGQGGAQAAPASMESPSSEEQLAEFKAAIREKYDMKEQAFRDNNPEPILTRFYTESVISTDPEGNTKVGRVALAPVYDEVIGSLVKIESYNTFVNGDAGWDWVNFHVSFPPGVEEEPFTFKMLFLWERIDGEWWSHGEMYVLGEFALKG